jgi:mannose/fructose/N-acetylgalactosamine-specific phosphotransferase system component IIC
MASTAPATFTNESGVVELQGTLTTSGTSTGDQTITGALIVTGAITGASLTTTGAGAVNIGGALNHDGSTAGFFGTAPATKQAVTGALSTVADAPAKAVLTSIIAALVAYGLITNSTT